MKQIYEFLTGSFIGLLAWFFGGLDGLFQVLVVCACVDWITGMTAAAFEGKLSSTKGFRGIARKCIMFILVGVANILDKYLPGSTGAMRASVCLFYIVTEGISIIENADRLDIPMPGVFRRMLANVKKQLDTKGNVEHKENHPVKKTPVKKSEKNEKAAQS